MSEIVPVGKYKTFCPQCGAQMGVKQGVVDLEDDTRIFCPIHGDQGRLQDFRAKLLDEAKDDLIKKAREIIRSRIR